MTSSSRPGAPPATSSIPTRMGSCRCERTKKDGTSALYKQVLDNVTDGVPDDAAAAPAAAVPVSPSPVPTPPAPPLLPNRKPSTHPPPCLLPRPRRRRADPGASGGCRGDGAAPRRSGRGGRRAGQRVGRVARRRQRRHRPSPPDSRHAAEGRRRRAGCRARFPCSPCTRRPTPAASSAASRGRLVSVRPGQGFGHGNGGNGQGGNGNAMPRFGHGGQPSPFGAQGRGHGKGGGPHPNRAAASRATAPTSSSAAATKAADQGAPSAAPRSCVFDHPRLLSHRHDPYRQEGPRSRCGQQAIARLGDREAGVRSRCRPRAHLPR